MPPREQARIAPEDVPKAAFGSHTVAIAASEQTATAHSLREGRSPSRRREKPNSPPREGR